MPRIKSKKAEYMGKDIGSWVEGKMREKKLTQKDLAFILGISQQALGQKINKSHFNYMDLLKIFKAIGATDEEILKLMKI